MRSQQVDFGLHSGHALELDVERLLYRGERSFNPMQTILRWIAERSSVSVPVPSLTTARLFLRHVGAPGFGPEATTLS